jgi:hypothetical protein
MTIQAKQLQETQDTSESPGKPGQFTPLLTRVVENATGDTWRNVRHELDHMHLVTLETKEGRIAKRSMTTKGQRDILAALELREPAQILDYELPPQPSSPRSQHRVVIRLLGPAAIIVPVHCRFLHLRRAYHLSNSGPRGGRNGHFE